MLPNPATLPPLFPNLPNRAAPPSHTHTLLSSSSHAFLAVTCPCMAPFCLSASLSAAFGASGVSSKSSLRSSCNVLGLSFRSPHLHSQTFQFILLSRHRFRSLGRSQPRRLIGRRSRWVARLFRSLASAAYTLVPSVLPCCSSATILLLLFSFLGTFSSWICPRSPHFLIPRSHSRSSAATNEQVRAIAFAAAA